MNETSRDDARIRLQDGARIGRRIVAGLLACAATIPACESAREGHGGWRFEEGTFRTIEPLDLASAETAPPRPIDEAEIAAAEEGAIMQRPFPERLELPIDEIRAAALAHNLELRAELVRPAIAAADVAAEEAKFEATIVAGYRRNDAGLVTNLETGTPLSQDRFDLGVEVPLATGGTISVASPLFRADQQVTGPFGDDLWTAQLEFSISQPLLRGAWFDANMHSIRVARYEGQRVEASTKLAAIRVLSAADRAYWNLYAAWGELEVRRAQYDLALRQLEAAQRRVAAGDAPEIEVVRAESGLGRTVESIIVADSRLRQAQRLLKRLLNRPDLPVESPTGIVPATPPAPVELSLDGAALANRAVRNRMEMLELELQLAIDASTISLRRNQALPAFAFDYTYAFEGLSGNAGGAYGNLFDGDFYQLGLSAEVPIGNEIAENRLRASILQRVQRLATREDRRQSIRVEVLDSLDQIRQSWQRILAARLEVVLATRTLEGEQRQFEVGLRTSTDVLDASAQLADARSREVRALADWQIALVDLAFATGTTLGGARVGFGEG
jgi:outer membrane protein